MPLTSAPGSARGAEPDAALLRRLASAEPEAALEALYDRFAGRVYAVGLRALADRALAEDMVQETFVRLWRSAGRYDPARGSAAAWIFTMARRAAIDLHRRRPPAGPPLPDDLRDEADALEPLLVGAAVRDGLTALSPAHREVLELTYDSGLSQASIAERLGLPLGTVKSRTHHALRSLREVLVERGVDA